MGYYQNVDVWSVGCIFGEMIRGEVVFQGLDYIDQWNKITQQLGTPPSDFRRRLKPSVCMYVESQPSVRGLSIEKVSIGFD